MTFTLTRPPSPEEHISVQGRDDDHLFSALHSALSTFVPGSSTHQDPHHDMGKEKERAGIDIVVDSDCLILKGTGVDVEPALLKGHIVLHLTEPTSIKEIKLLFRGKARLPAPSADSSLALGVSPQWYTICNHEWSFLEGEKRHSHTLKAGYHQFPFQLQLGGSLPSTITSSVCGGAHVSYKLRAIAVRPGLAHNMQTVMPVSIVRTFAPEALEYQQSLEIENTWPDKLMYSIMIPHKAWAAGDELAVVVKFSPLTKGVRVLTVATTINETTRFHCRGGVQEHTRVVVTACHDFQNGHAVPILKQMLGTQSATGSWNEERSPSFGTLGILAGDDLALRQVPTSSSSSSSASSSPSTSSHEPYPVRAQPPLELPAVSAAESNAAVTTEQDVPMQSQDDVVTHFSLFIPKSVTPSHSLEPIAVTHRIRWSILMSNLDGHTSELRCSLPLHILDARLLEEARTNSAVTRRLLLGGPELPVEEEHDAELPSYSAHVRDRVANMYLPDAATTRVLNPWTHPNVSPTLVHDHQNVWTPPGAASPLMPHLFSSHLPHLPQTENTAPLEWVNTELLLSLSNSAPPRSCSTMSPHSHSPTDPASRPESRLVSRRGSRAPSPERHLSMTTITSLPTSSPLTVSHETFVHDGHASRSLPGLFNLQLKPYLSLTSPSWLSSRSNSHSSLTSLPDAGHPTFYRGAQNMPRPLSTILPVSGAGSHMFVPSPAATTTTSEGIMPASAMWHRAFTEVPDYEVASRGFIGGVTPLTSMRGLPSYEEAGMSVNGDASEDDRLTIRRTRGTPRRERVP